METDWHRNDHDLQTLVVPLAENCYYSGIPEEEVTRRTIMRYYKRKNPMLIREMIRNVYKECKGVPKSNCLTKEQRLSLQMDEFMNRRYEFRYNTQIGGSGIPGAFSRFSFIFILLTNGHKTASCLMPNPKVLAYGTGT